MTSQKTNSARPRILQVCAVDFTAFHLLRPLMARVRDHGFEVEFACADGPWAAELRDEGFRHRPIPTTRSVAPYKQLRAVSRLARNLRVDPVDLVHTHTPVGGFVGRAAAFTWRGPVIHTFHGLPFRDAEQLTPTEQLFVATERMLAKRTTKFFSQAREDGSRAIRLGIARAADMLVIGNGVDTEQFHPDAAARVQMRRQLDIPDEAVVVCMVARLVREKGVLEFADAALADSNPLVRYIVVGQALESDRTSVMNDLARHPVVAALGPRWRRLGHRDDVADILRSADIFVLPSHREGLPRSVIEAMATGLPTVASDIPACRELIRESETGILVPVGNATRLALAIADLANDPSVRRVMGARARIEALAEHDERRVVQRQIRVYEELLMNGGSTRTRIS